jgi:hypothetical protein
VSSIGAVEPAVVLVVDAVDEELAEVVDDDVEDEVELEMADPAAAAPLVGDAQATVKTAEDSKAAAAMPWRRFTGNTFG